MYLLYTCIYYTPEKFEYLRKFYIMHPYTRYRKVNKCKNKLKLTIRDIYVPIYKLAVKHQTKNVCKVHEISGTLWNHTYTHSLDGSYP